MSMKDRKKATLGRRIRYGILAALLPLIFSAAAFGQSAYGDFVIEVPVEFQGMMAGYRTIVDATVSCVIATDADFLGRGSELVDFDDIDEVSPGEARRIGMGVLTTSDDPTEPLFFYSDSQLGRGSIKIGQMSPPGTGPYNFQQSGPGQAFVGTVEIGIVLGQGIGGVDPENRVANLLERGYEATHYLCNYRMRYLEGNGIRVCEETGGNVEECQPAIGSEIVRQVYGPIG
jgi:hypothetical protein